MGKSKKMLLKILAIVAAFAMVIAFVGAFVACGGDDTESGTGTDSSTGTGSGSGSSTGSGSGSGSSTGSGSGSGSSTGSGSGSTSTTDSVYIVDGIANLSTAEDYYFIHFSEYGDDHGLGMVNINDWGGKKLVTDYRGRVDGAGAVWGIELDVSDATTYALSVYCDLDATGQDVYEGTCRMTYLFNGTYTASGSEYTLSAPTYCLVTFQTDDHWDYIATTYDFADYLPGCNDLYQADENGVFFMVDSTGDILWASMTSPNGEPNDDFRFTPEHLLDSVFGGATFVTSGSTITEVKDAVAPAYVGYI